MEAFTGDGYFNTRLPDGVSVADSVLERTLHKNVLVNLRKAVGEDLADRMVADVRDKPKYGAS